MEGRRIERLVNLALRGFDREVLEAFRGALSREGLDVRRLVDIWTRGSNSEEEVLFTSSLASLLDWQRFKAVYRFDETAAQEVLGGNISVREEDYHLLPYRTFFLNANVRAAEEAAVGCFFSKLPVDGGQIAMLTLRLEAGGMVRNCVRLGGSDAVYEPHLLAESRGRFETLVRPYLGLARLLASRNVQMIREAPPTRGRGFGQAAPRRLEEWRVSYRKAADFAPRPAGAGGEGRPLLERPAAPRLNVQKKRSIRAHRQRYWRICQDDPNWLIREWVEKPEKIGNADAPGDLPVVERDVPL